MIDIRYYTIIVRKDRFNNNFEELFKNYIGPKNEDENLFSLYTMSEDVRDEILNNLSRKANLQGLNKDGKWEDFVLVTSTEGIEKGKCNWLNLQTKRSKQDIDLVTHVSFVNKLT